MHLEASTLKSEEHGRLILDDQIKVNALSDDVHSSDIRHRERHDKGNVLIRFHGTAFVTEAAPQNFIENGADRGGHQKQRRPISAPTILPIASPTLAWPNLAPTTLPIVPPIFCPAKMAPARLASLDISVLENE